MSNSSEEKAAPDVDRVEETLRAAIIECAENVTAYGEEAPENPAGNAEAAVSCANVARGWADVAIGLVAGLERFRLAHDKVKGGQTGKVGADGIFQPQDESDERKLLANVLDAA